MAPIYSLENRESRRKLPPIASAFHPKLVFSISYYILKGNANNHISGTNPRPEALRCLPERGLTGPKIAGHCHKDRRIQTIIDEIILQTCSLF
jgi:hypothetical protein